MMDELNPAVELARERGEKKEMGTPSSRKITKHSRLQSAHDGNEESKGQSE